MKPVLVFDIETIPDVPGLRQLNSLDASLSDDEVAEPFRRRGGRLPAGGGLGPAFQLRDGGLDAVVLRQPAPQ